jgi:hypothetical protein
MLLAGWQADRLEDLLVFAHWGQAKPLSPDG